MCAGSPGGEPPSGGRSALLPLEASCLSAASSAGCESLEDGTSSQFPISLGVCCGYVSAVEVNQVVLGLAAMWPSLCPAPCGTHTCPAQGLTPGPGPAQVRELAPPFSFAAHTHGVVLPVLEHAHTGTVHTEHRLSRSVDTLASTHVGACRCSVPPWGADVTLHSACGAACCHQPGSMAA